MPATFLDHLVLTVRDAAATRRFYVDGLGMEWREFAPGRHALFFGLHKLNLHLAADRIEPRAENPGFGTADFCLHVDEPLDAARARLEGLGFPVVHGPVEQSGAAGPIRSLYFRDPDGNLVELSRPLPAS